jgi:hypothetical protein
MSLDALALIALLLVPLAGVAAAIYLVLVRRRD